MFRALMLRTGAARRCAGRAQCFSRRLTRLHAQTPTGTITGRVNDSGDLAVPGATVTIASPNLQGTRSTVTSANGDYIFPACRPAPTPSPSS